MEKIRVTAEEYNKIAEGQASIFWRKVFSMPANIQGEERETLKRKFDNEYDEYMSQYDIIPFSINTECEQLKKLINNTCHKEEDKNGGTMYKGHLLSSELIVDFIHCNDYKFIEYNYYTVASYNAEQKAIIQYCEGDIYIHVFDDVQSFDNELNRVVTWFKENY